MHSANRYWALAAFALLITSCGETVNKREPQRPSFYGAQNQKSSDTVTPSKDVDNTPSKGNDETDGVVPGLEDTDDIMTDEVIDQIIKDLTGDVDPSKGGSTPDDEETPSKDDGDDGQVASKKIGIHFEDWTDWDFNDVVVCFEGKFKIDENSNIISLTDQTLTAQTFSASACKHRVDLTIIDPDGDTKPITLMSENMGGDVSLPFKKGSRFEMKITLRDGPLCQPYASQLSMKDKPRALISTTHCIRTGK